MERQGLKIMMIDDRSNEAELMSRALTKFNLANELIHITDGAAALDLIFRNSNSGENETNVPPGLILLRLSLQNMGALEILEKLKSNPRTRAIPVVVLTSSADDPDVKKALALGADNYMVKPVEFKKFSKTMADLGLYWMAVNKFNT